MDLTGYLQFVAALAAVLALILLLAWIARRSGLAGRLGAAAAPRRGARRLALVEVMPLDARRRLVLLRCERREHLVLLGQGQGADLLIESRDAAVEGDES